MIEASGAENTRVLDGIRVLDLTQYYSGPLATLFLAGLGAEVIRVDPPSGDMISDAPLFAGPDGVSIERRTDEDMGAVFLKRCRAKKAITLNLKSDEGRALFYRLVQLSDVVMDNFSVGVTERLGVDYAALREINPKIIQCAITGYGSTGPDAGKKSYDVIAQAMSGLMSITGEPGGKPMKAGSPLADAVSSSFALSGVLAALFQRTRTGEGQFVDISMVDCLFSLIYDDPLEAYEALGMEMQQGNRIPRFSPFNLYETRDGTVVIGISNDENWRKLAKIMGRGDLADAPDHGRMAWRVEHNDEIDALVSHYPRGKKSSQALEQLEAAGIPASPVLDIHALKKSPQLAARGMLMPLVHPNLGALPGLSAPGFPIKFSGAETKYEEPAVLSGHHNQEIFSGLLGLADSDIVRLKSGRII
ncbi:MAG: CoA transferase [Proteobacteria bacterium]|nr:CoA transferase [Pseudomonadota bacterium]